MTRRHSHPIDERLDDVERRLREVRRSLKMLSRSGDRSPAILPAPTPAPMLKRPAAGGTPSPQRRPSVGPPSDRRRFLRYFASASFPPGLSVREERRIRRNKIFVILLTAGFLLWMLYWFLAT